MQMSTVSEWSRGHCALYGSHADEHWMTSVRKALGSIVAFNLAEDSGSRPCLRPAYGAQDTA
eukprot:1147077-Pelagomonas_calceolata.AAC.1